MRDPLATALCALFFLIFAVVAFLCMWVGALVHGVIFCVLAVMAISGAVHFADPIE